MNTKAVYMVCEDGKEFYFKTNHAGGFSYPFEAADYLGGLKHAMCRSRIGEQEIFVTPLLEQMKGTYSFPEKIEGKLLFESISKDLLTEEMVMADTPYFITIDVNKNTVGFHFNEQCEELKELLDIEIPVYAPTEKCSGEYFKESSLARQMFEETGEPFATANERIFREMIEDHCREPKQEISQQMM